MGEPGRARVLGDPSRGAPSEPAARVGARGLWWPDAGPRGRTGVGAQGRARPWGGRRLRSHAGQGLKATARGRAQGQGGRKRGRGQLTRDGGGDQAQQRQQDSGQRGPGHDGGCGRRGRRSSEVRGADQPSQAAGPGGRGGYERGGKGRGGYVRGGKGRRGGQTPADFPARPRAASSTSLSGI